MDGALTRAEHMEFAKRMEDEHTRQNKRISNLEEAFNQNTRLLVSVEKLASNMESMQKEQADQGERLEKLESKSGEKWDKLVGYVISGVVGIIVGFRFKQIGV
jgi:predicted nuclease with TOPRIM domain